MVQVKHKLVVMSGKGGVGKTTVAVNLAHALSEKGLKVGLLDADIHGPNVSKMLKLENKKLLKKHDRLVPIKTENNIKVMSMAFLLEKEQAVIWRGPLKHNIIKQFIEDVEWGELDYLIIDFPPGTGDECISISQLLETITGSIIVSTPQQVALIDVLKSIDFSRKVNIPIIGLIENMSGDIFGNGSVEDMANKQKISFLGTLKLDSKIRESGDEGKPFITNNLLEVSESFNKIVEKIILIIKQGMTKNEGVKNEI